MAEKDWSAKPLQLPKHHVPPNNLQESSSYSANHRQKELCFSLVSTNAVKGVSAPRRKGKDSQEDWTWKISSQLLSKKLCLVGFEHFMYPYALLCLTSFRGKWCRDAEPCSF